MAARGGRIELAVEGDDAAEGGGRDRCGRRPRRPRAIVGATATPQGLACLTMTQARRGELAHALDGGVGIGDVVEGQVLALQHVRAARHRHRARPGRGRTRPAGAGSRRSAGPAPSRRRAADVAGNSPRRGRLPRREVGRDHRVVARGVREGLGGQLCAQWRTRCRRRAPRARPSSARVVGRIHDHRHGFVVLGRGAQHRRSADVDVLDRLLVAAVGARHRRRERVEVHHQQVDRRDAVLGHDRLVGAAPSEQAAVNLRMQRLDAPVHDLREAGVAARPRGPGCRARPAAARCRRWRAARRRARRSARASSTSPVLSETESSARRTGSGMA